PQAGRPLEEGDVHFNPQLLRSGGRLFRGFRRRFAGFFRRFGSGFGRRNAGFAGSAGLRRGAASPAALAGPEQGQHHRRDKCSRNKLSHLVTVLSLSWPFRVTRNRPFFYLFSGIPPPFSGTGKWIIHSLRGARRMMPASSSAVTAR